MALHQFGFTDHHFAPGALRTFWLRLASVILLTAALVMLLRSGLTPAPASPPESLVLFAAAGTRPAVEEVAEMYERQFRTSIDLQFAGSNTLLNQLQINRYQTADLYLAADAFYIERAVAIGLVSEVFPVAYQHPVIIVRKDFSNPHGQAAIDCVEDLIDYDLRVSMGNPDQAAIGRSVKNLLSPSLSGEADLWARLERHVIARGVFKPTVNDVAVDVKIGAVDAGIVWNATASIPQFRNDLKVITVDALSREPEQIALAVLRGSDQSAAAVRFAHFLTARDAGLAVFARHGMRPILEGSSSDSPAANAPQGSVR